MIQNIKVDTIYYHTNSDFEMEFNLCGCCKMRLLTDKAEKPREFVNLLARAVNRSQVIICCGKLFESDGIISIISQAIKKPLKKINNSEYGIADNSEIEIIEGSVPLVNADGCFCGCIAESGPQSLIMLTDNKGIRKTVMKQLIHPYIEELSLLLHKSHSEASADENAPEEPAEEISPETDAEILSEEISSEAEDLSEALSEEETPQDSNKNTAEALDNDADSAETNTESETEPNSYEKINSDENTDEDTVISENNDNDTATDKVDNLKPETQTDNNQTSDSSPKFEVDPEDINSGFDLFLEPKRVKFNRKKNNYDYSAEAFSSDADDAFIAINEDDEYYADSDKKPDKLLNLPILILAIILLVALAALCYLLVFVPMKSDYAFSEFIKHIFSVSVV